KPRVGSPQGYLISESIKAQLGDAAAQYSLGLEYKHGSLVFPKDLTRAFDWFAKSANKGYPGACFELAQMYLKGNGVAKNEALGAEWLRKAYGYSPASLLMSDLYTNGVGVPQDQAEALRWLRLSAGQRNTEAQFKLGERYRTGQGVEQSTAEAVILYSKAV